MKVKVYSTSWCPYCHALMDWLDSLDVKYIIVDAERLLADDGSEINSVPAISIDGDLIFGFNRPAITKSLKTAGLIAEKGKK